MLLKLTERQRLAVHYTLLVLGTCLMAVSSIVFLDPCGMVPGGFTGIAIIVKAVTPFFPGGGVPLWLTNVLLNIPMIPLLIHYRGWVFARRTVAGFLLFTGWLAVLPQLPISLEGDMFLISVFGGLLMGIGIGMVFLAKGTTGGTDMAAALLQHFFPHLSMARLMQALDIVIVTVGVFVFGLRMSLYSAIVVYLTAWMSDRMIDGLKNSRMTLIISDASEQIAQEILENMDRGVTGLSGRGMYTNQAKDVLLCVVSPKEIVQIKEIVHKIDQKAFVVVVDSREVSGEGFVQYNQ